MTKKRESGESLKSTMEIDGTLSSSSNENANVNPIAHMTCNLSNIPLIDVKFNNTIVKFVVDSGSWLTIMNYHTYVTIGSPVLKPTNRKIFALGAKEPIVFLGKLKITVKSGGRDRTKAIVYVLGDKEVNAPCLLSRSLSEKTGLITLDLGNTWNIQNFLTFRSYANRPMTDVLLNKIKVKFLVDSGSSVTFIDRSTYVKVGSPPLTQAEIVVSAFKPFILLGKFEFTLVRGDFRVKTILYVKDIEYSSCVLSKSDSEKLGLLKLHPGLTNECAHIYLNFNM